MNKYNIQSGHRNMKTKDLFKVDRSAKKLNESLAKTFGKKLNLEAFDMPQLEDARNKLRTQIHNARSQSGFNETLENEALTQAQWMLDAINAELAEREEFVVDPHTADVSYESDIQDEVAEADDGMRMRQEVMSLLDQFEKEMNEMGGYGDINHAKVLSLLAVGKAEAAADEAGYSFTDQDGGEIPGIENYIMDLQSEFEHLIDSVGESNDQTNEVAPPGDKYERMVKHIKKGYAKDGKLTPKEKSIAYATAWKAKNKNESIEGDDMSTLKEGEIQQAQSIVTAKTMVDRVGRWIEELSGMENDTLLQLGDQIRDEMGQEQAKGFISSVAPAIQQALENLKQTREALASGVRTLTGEEQSAAMLGAEPEAEMGADEFGGEAAPDEMNAEPEVGAPEDEFAAAEPAAGGAEEAGRMKRESIDRSNNLLKVLAG